MIDSRNPVEESDRVAQHSHFDPLRLKWGERTIDLDYFLIKSSF